jgi:hypothetical protein
LNPVFFAHYGHGNVCLKGRLDTDLLEGCGTGLDILLISLRPAIRIELEQDINVSLRR